MKEKWKFFIFSRITQSLSDALEFLTWLHRTLFWSFVWLYHSSSSLSLFFFPPSDDCKVSRAIPFFILTSQLEIASVVIRAYPITTNVIKFLINKSWFEIQMQDSLSILDFASISVAGCRINGNLKCHKKCRMKLSKLLFFWEHFDLFAIASCIQHQWNTKKEAFPSVLSFKILIKALLCYDLSCMQIEQHA